MEKELSKILDKIEELYFDVDIENKRNELLELWTKYYQLASTYKIELGRAYDLYLLGENVSYVLDTKINYSKSLEVPNEIINKLTEILSSNEVKGISLSDANTLLTWIVNRTWNNLSYFGIDMSRNSLNGFCEIAQLSCLYPLEQLGLKVTKNKAEDSFNYPFHHAFGTVEIPVEIDGKVTNYLFLIDPTYKQFFTAVRCNHGRYYAKEENTGLIVAPDPGYFMKSNKEKMVAETIIKNGFILLTDEVAKVYGDGFEKASISLDDYNKHDVISTYTGSYYINKIKNTSTEYCTELEELEGYAFEFDIPSNKNISNK